MKKIKLLTLCMFLSLTGLMTGCESDLQYSKSFSYIKSGEDLNFFILADPHHFSKKMFDNGEAFKNFFNTNDGKLLYYTDEIINVLIDDIKENKPNFLLVAGDLTCIGDRVSHMEFANYLEEIESYGTDVFVVPGNHDLNNCRARKFEGSESINVENISTGEWKEIYGLYGYDKAISIDKDSASYLATPSEDVWLIMLDSTIKNESDQPPIKGGELSARTINWIEDCGELAKKNNAELIAVMHHSLLDHSRIFNNNYTLNNNEDVLEVFQKANIKVVLTGHIHVQDIKSYENHNGIIYDIGTSCISVYPNQYGILNFTPGIGFTYGTRRIDLTTVSKEYIDDHDLKSFEEYTIDLFIEQCCSQYETCISELNELNNDDLQKVYEVIVEMNKMYFSGYRNEALSDIMDSEGFKLLERISPCFAKEYAMSMVNDERTNNNILFVPIN